jgi:hypothetical protein
LDLLPVMFWIYNLFGSTSGILDLWAYSFSQVAPPPWGAMSRAIAERDALLAQMILNPTNYVLLAEFVAAEDAVKRLEAAAAADAANAAADAEIIAVVASGDAIRISAAARAKLAAQGSVDALARSSNQQVSPALAAPAVAQSAAAVPMGATRRSTTRGAASSDDDDDDEDSDYLEESDDEEGGTGQKRHRRSWVRTNGSQSTARRKRRREGEGRLRGCAARGGGGRSIRADFFSATVTHHISPSSSNLETNSVAIDAACQGGPGPRLSQFFQSRAKAGILSGPATIMRNQRRELGGRTNTCLESAPATGARANQRTQSKKYG